MGDFCVSVIFSILLFLTCVKMEPKEFAGPTGIERSDETTCEEFSRFARFNPYSVLDDKWFIFYYWSSIKIADTFVFTIPTVNDTKNLHGILDDAVESPVNWSARQVLMWDERHTCYFLTEQDDRGAYWLYILPKYVDKDKKIPAQDVRLKQIGDNLYIGLMFCKELAAFAMAKLSNMPRKSYLQDAAATLGYRRHGGKSYLYQGHHWMPIPEQSEAEYWRHSKYNKRYHSQQ